MRHRALLAAVATALGAAALVAVGAASAVNDPNAPRQRHTVADMQRARSLTLRRGDLAAGWTRAPDAEGPVCKGSPDESALVETARVDPTFTWRDGITTLGSEVDIFRTARESRTDWRLSTLSLMQTCLLQSARSGFGKDVRVTMTSADTLTPPASVERSLHYRLVFAVRSKQKTVSFVADVIAIGRGRATVVLHTLTVARPLPASVLSTLVQTMSARLNGGRKGA